MNLKDAILLLKQYQGYESFDNGVVLKHSFNLTDETVDTLLSALSVNSIEKPLTLWEPENMEGQKVLLYRMKSTEPLELGTVKQRGDVLGDAGMLAYHELYLETWVAFSYQAQEKPDFDKPLTLEKLRGMVGQPVWVEYSGGFPKNQWRVVKFHEKEKIVAFTDDRYEILAEYGKTWLAYAYTPAHIDREAWEPCSRCRPQENSLDRFSGHEFLIDDAEIYFYDSEDGWEGEKIKFCPWCGRPLTEEAWDELEKRLRG